MVNVFDVIILDIKCDKINFYNWTHVVCFASYNSDASVANYELLLAVWRTNLWCFTDSKVTGKSIASTSVIFRWSIDLLSIFCIWNNLLGCGLSGRYELWRFLFRCNLLGYDLPGFWYAWKLLHLLQFLNSVCLGFWPPGPVSCHNLPGCFCPTSLGWWYHTEVCIKTPLRQVQRISSNSQIWISWEAHSSLSEGVQTNIQTFLYKIKAIKTLWALA